MTEQQQGSTDPTRRSAIKGAAWSVPVIALSVAAPAASASTCVASDYVATLSTAVTSMPSYVTLPNGGTPLREYDPTGAPYVHFQSTLTYNGPADLPAGARLTVAFALDSVRVWSFGITSTSGTGVANLSGPTPVSITNTQWAREFTTTAVTTPGTTYIIDWWARTGTNAGGSGTYGATYWHPGTVCDGALTLPRMLVAEGSTRTGSGTSNPAFWLHPYKG